MQNATEAEQVLGGVYSQLSQNMHMPLAYLLLHEVQPTVINAVERGEFKLDILTGLQALSRSSENQSLLVAASEINAIVPIMAQLSKRFNPDKLIDSNLRANGVNVDDYTWFEGKETDLDALGELFKAKTQNTFQTSEDIKDEKLGKLLNMSIDDIMSEFGSALVNKDFREGFDMDMASESRVITNLIERMIKSGNLKEDC